VILTVISREKRARIFLWRADGGRWQAEGRGVKMKPKGSSTKQGIMLFTAVLSELSIRTG